MIKKAIPMEELVPLLQLQMENGGLACLTVTGYSMMPMLISSRDKVWLSGDCSQLKAGEVILYRRDNGCYVLHRIIKMSDPMICCGDNQWEKEKVYFRQVIGVVTAYEKNGQHIQLNSFHYCCYRWLMVSLFCLRRPYITARRRVGAIRRMILGH